MKTVSTTYANSFGATTTVAAILGLAAGASIARVWDQQATDAGMSTEPASTHSFQRGAGGAQREFQLEGR